MSVVFKKISGGIVLTVAAFFFGSFTASINAAQNMSGPMNMSPSPTGWFYIVLVVDALCLCAAFGGIKLLELRARTVGMLTLVIGIFILVLSIKNHVNAPPLDGVNDTNKLPVALFLHYAVYSLAGVCVVGGFWLSAKGFVRKSVK